MHLKEVQQVLSQAGQGPNSAQEALKQLKACVERSVEFLTEGNTVQAQVFLERGFTNMVAASHYLNLDLEKVVQRERNRHKMEARQNHEERVILIFSDHAELRVSGELRGTIPLYGPEDYQELRQIAQIFQCRMEHADHLQLDLFSLLNTKSAS